MRLTTLARVRRVRQVIVTRLLDYVRTSSDAVIKAETARAAAPPTLSPPALFPPPRGGSIHPH